jgi:hypothetical protein
VSAGPHATRGRRRAAHNRGSNESQKRQTLRCAIYTRVSTDNGLEQDFNSLDAQREACAAYFHACRRFFAWCDRHDDIEDLNIRALEVR